MATCDDTINGYICYCQQGYTGKHCETSKFGSIHTGYCGKASNAYKANLKTLNYHTIECDNSIFAKYIIKPGVNQISNSNFLINWQKSFASDHNWLISLGYIIYVQFVVWDKLSAFLYEDAHDI